MSSLGSSKKIEKKHEDEELREKLEGEQWRKRKMIAGRRMQNGNSGRSHWEGAKDWGEESRLAPGWLLACHFHTSRII